MVDFNLIFNGFTLGATTRVPRSSYNFEWTTFTESPDTRKIYVSSSEGNDANDGLSELTPKATWWGPSGGMSLMREGYPDWLLLKRGDIWTFVTESDQLNYRIGMVKGRSSQEPSLVSSYGNSTVRPKIVNTCIIMQGNGNQGCSYSRISGIHLERTMESCPWSTGISIGGYLTTNVIVEDCLIEKWALCINIDPTTWQAYGDLTDINIRGCVLVDSYATASHAQGILAGYTNGLTIEGCILDHNGWSLDYLPDSTATIFSHNLYLDHSLQNVTIKNCISSRAAAQGIMLRGGGIIEDCLVLANPFNSVGQVRETIIRRNVLIDGANVHTPGGINNGDGWAGFTVAFYGLDPDGNPWPQPNIEIYENIFAHQETALSDFGLQFGPYTYTYGPGKVKKLSVHDNIFYDWNIPLYFTDGSVGQYEAPITIDNNVFINHGSSPTDPQWHTLVWSNYPIDPTIVFTRNTWSFSSVGGSWWHIENGFNDSSTFINKTGETNGVYTEPVFLDPDRTVITYATSKGITPTLEGFLTEARKLSRLSFNRDYMALAVNAYIRDGFTRL